MNNIMIRAVSLLLVIGLVLPSGTASAQGLSIIRDDEIESTIRLMSTPVFRAAGLRPQSVKIHLVRDDNLNAFVAGGQRLFIHTGLLIQSESPSQVIGVIAHETGHIAGGHLARTGDALSKSSLPAVLSVLLGTATGIVTGRGDVGAAIALGGQGVALRNFLRYSRTQESAADQAALLYLDQTKQSARGLLEFMAKLEDQELLSVARQDPYVRTHPLTRERIDTIENHVAGSPYSDAEVPPDIIVRFERMRAKLIGFLAPLERTLVLYPEADASLPSRYARAIAHYRKADLDRALPLIDGLIAEQPADPYFHELKGQVLFENARAREALASYLKAIDLNPSSTLVRRDLARVQIELNDPALLDAAIDNLNASLAGDRRSAFTWRQLAIAYGRKGDTGRSSLALGEEALLQGKVSNAKFQAGRAAKLFPKGSREWLQAQDILLAANKGKPDGEKTKPK